MTLKQDFDINGYSGPYDVFDRTESLTLANSILEIDKKIDLRKSNYRFKSNVLFSFVDKVTRSPKLIDLVSQIIGSNFHCWDVIFWIRHANDNLAYGLHQDAQYWNFDNKDKSVVAWFAFTDVTAENSGIEYIKGSHQYNLVDLSKGSGSIKDNNTIKNINLSTNRIKPLVSAGQALIHHPYIIHCSGPNATATPRVAIQMVFASTICKPIATTDDESTIMITGNDDYHHMIHDPLPVDDWSLNINNWEMAYDRQCNNFYQQHGNKSPYE